MAEIFFLYGVEYFSWAFKAGQFNNLRKNNDLKPETNIYFKLEKIDNSKYKIINFNCSFDQFFIEKCCYSIEDLKSIKEGNEIILNDDNCPNFLKPNKYDWILLSLEDVIEINRCLNTPYKNKLIGKYDSNIREFLLEQGEKYYKILTVTNAYQKFINCIRKYNINYTDYEYFKYNELEDIENSVDDYLQDYEITKIKQWMDSKKQLDK